MLGSLQLRFICRDFLTARLHLARNRLSNTAGAEGLVSCLDGGLLHQAQNAPNILDVAGKPALPSKGQQAGG
jgi:hypothetical protein